MITAYKEFLTHYIDFEGKMSRRNFWLAMLDNLIICAALGFLLLIFAGLAAVFSVNIGPVAFLFGLLAALIIFVLIVFKLAIIIPLISSAVRRLRDAGYHWAYLFLLFAPIAGLVVLIVLFTRKIKKEG
jgi:uncharacterized membrane protein YhaH (DUF805 family)